MSKILCILTENVDRLSAMSSWWRKSWETRAHARLKDPWNGNEPHVSTDDGIGKQLSISDFFADLSDFTMMKVQRKMAK